MLSSCQSSCCLGSQASTQPVTHLDPNRTFGSRHQWLFASESAKCFYVGPLYPKTTPGCITGWEEPASPRNAMWVPCRPLTSELGGAVPCTVCLLTCCAQIPGRRSTGLLRKHREVISSSKATAMSTETKLCIQSELCKFCIG